VPTVNFFLTPDTRHLKPYPATTPKSSYKEFPKNETDVNLFDSQMDYGYPVGESAIADLGESYLGQQVG